MDENTGQTKEQQKTEAATKNAADLAKTGAKVAANSVAGPVGGAAVDLASKTKLGKAALDTVGKTASRNPLARKALSNPMVGQANNAMNALGSQSSNGLGGALGTAAGAAETEETTSETSGSEDVIATAKKIKKALPIIGTILPIIGMFVGMVFLIVIVMIPITFVQQNIDGIKQGLSIGVEKFLNFVTGDGWMTNEDSYFAILKKEYDRFNNTTSSGVQLDIPLIASTSHYTKMVSPNVYETPETGDEEYPDFNDFYSPIVSEDQTKAFYNLAKDKLGSPNTLWPGQKRLLGHLVKTEITIENVDWDVAASYWSKFFALFTYTITDTLHDMYWNTPLATINPVTSISSFISTYTLIRDYANATGSNWAYFDYNTRNLIYEAQEFLKVFKDAFDAAISGDFNDDGSAVPPDDKNSILKVPVPVVKRTMNYGDDIDHRIRENTAQLKDKMNKENISYSDEKDLLKKAKQQGGEYKTLAEQIEKDKEDYKFTYSDYLRRVYIPATYFYEKEVEPSIIDDMIDEIFQQRDAYLYLIEGATSGYACGGNCSYQVGQNSISNLKVRLLQCKDTEDRTKPIPGEELVDFEKYILGVVYAEIGAGAPPEAAKVQAIAARSYALTRPKQMGNAGGLSLEQENGQWILSIHNCTEDQVYCDPDKGCAKRGDKNSTTYSGTDKYNKYKDPLPMDSPIRTAVAEVVGKVLLDAGGEIVPTGYLDKAQNKWTAMANEGKDHTQILMEHYSSATGISNGSCNNVCTGATGDFTQWKQYGEPWSNILMGSGTSTTIHEIGCAVTAVAIQIAHSGVEVTIPDFNPGTFVQELKRVGGLDSFGLITWSKASDVAPRFQFYNRYTLKGMSKEGKLSKVQSLINDGCYLIMEVKGGGKNSQHWVAVDYVQNGTIYMMDPASTETDAWKKYGWAATSDAICYKVQ